MSFCVFSKEVNEAITARCKAEEPTDMENFDPVDYLNECYDEGTEMSEIVQYVSTKKKKLVETEQELLLKVEAQAHCSRVLPENSRTKAQGARDSSLSIAPLPSTHAVQLLCECVRSINERAQQSEEAVNAASGHIRKMDLAKKNISSSISTLSGIQLWMLQLGEVATKFENGNYVMCREALKAAESYRARYSESYSHLSKVKEIIEYHKNLCKQLESKTYYLIFEEDMSSSSTDSISLNADENLLRDVCAIVDLLDDVSWKRVRDVCIELLLRPYKRRFKKGTEDAKIEKTERRYTFMREILDHRSTLLFHTFPLRWRVPIELCITFAVYTRDEISKQLRESKNINMTVLMYVIEKTIEVEKDLNAVIQKSVELEKESNTLGASHETSGNQSSLPSYKINGAILSAFKEHMGFFVEKEKSNIEEVLSQPMIVKEVKKHTGPSIMTDDEAGIRPGMTLPLTQELFVLIKESLKRSLRLSQQDILMEMAGVWRNALKQFATNAQKLLRSPIKNTTDIHRVGIVANTASQCISTTQNLQMEVQHQSGLTAEDVQMSTAVDAFRALRSSSIKSLAEDLLKTLNPLFRDYVEACTRGEPQRTSSSTPEPSPATILRAITAELHEKFLVLAGILSPDVLISFLDNTAVKLTKAYASMLHGTSRIPMKSAKILKEGTMQLQKIFLELPNFNDPQRFSSPSMTRAYNHVVKHDLNVEISRLEVLESCTIRNMENFTNRYYEVIQSKDRCIADFVSLVQQQGGDREQVREWINVLSKKGVPQGE